MDILRKFALFVFSLLLFIALPIHTLAWTTKQSVMDRNVLLGWLKEGEVYDNIADTAAQLAEDSLAKKDDTQPTEGDVQQDNSGQMPDSATLIKAAKVALPPNVLQENVEAIINAMYDWLEGKTETIVLNLDLTDEKKAFIDALGNEAIARAASLPTCTAEQAGDFDPLSSNCIPSGTNIAAQAEKIKNELANSKDFLPDTNITGEDLTVGEEGAKNLLTEEFKAIPQAYRDAQNSSFIMTVSLLVFAVLIFFLGKTRRSGLKINAWLFGLAGIWALVVGSVFKLGNSMLTSSLVENSDVSLGATAVSSLLGQITGTIFKWHMVVGIAYIAVAVLCIMVITLMGKNKDTKSPNTKPDTKAQSPTPEQSAPKTKTTQSTPKKQPVTPKRNNLVQ